MNRERGQALIILAFGLLALAAFAGLAIDGGRLYAARRQTQNAADAAALAGARILAGFISTCARADVANDNRIAAAMVEMARYNGVDHFSPQGHIAAWYVDADARPLGSVGWNRGIPNGATGIKVTLTYSDTATFMRLLGRSHLVTTGDALAMVGPVVQTERGVLPIAVPETVIAEFRDKEPFTVFDDGLFCYGRKSKGCVLPPEERAITDTTQLSANAFYGWLNLSHIYNNAYRNGGPLDRAFTKNLSSGGCRYKPNGAVDVTNTGLKGWLSRDCPYPYPMFAGKSVTEKEEQDQDKEVEKEPWKEGDFIYGFAGTRTAALHELATGYGKGDILYWLIFDKTYTAKEMEKMFPGQAPPVGWMTGGGKMQGVYYHIVGFTAVELVSVDLKGKEKSITGIFQNAVIGEGLIDPGQGLGSNGRGTCSFPMLLGVKLWE